VRQVRGAAEGGGGGRESPLRKRTTSTGGGADGAIMACGVRGGCSCGGGCFSSCSWLCSMDSPPQDRKEDEDDTVVAIALTSTASGLGSSLRRSEEGTLQEAVIVVVAVLVLSFVGEECVRVAVAVAVAFVAVVVVGKASLGRSGRERTSFDSNSTISMGSVRVGEDS